MTVLLPGFTDAALRPVGDWHPSRFTASLSGTEDFTTDADRLLPLLEKVWTVAEAERFKADVWQVWLLRHMLETYPPDWPVEHLRGQLRFRQVVITMGRQNGKSVLGALIAFYLLTLHKRGARVGGFASNDRQAKIVYNRVKYAIDNDPRLSAEVRTTETRGLHLRHRPGIYQTLPADEESVQGEPFTGAIYDELHIGLRALWDAIVLGQKAQKNSLLVGITTAGDDDSDLLIDLYADGEAAIEGQDERFGFFCWEAEDDTLTEANVIRANPAIACGRVDLTTTMDDARKMWRAGPDKQGVTGKDRVIRYTLNRFVQGSATAWASLAAWNAGAAEEITHERDVVFAVCRTRSQEWASITATSSSKGRVRTHLVASIPNPTNGRLLEICKALAVRPCSFAVETAELGALGKALREAGYDVDMYGAAEMQAAAATTVATISKRTITHLGDVLTRLQFSHAKRRNTPEGWRISYTLSTGDIDAVMATVVGVHAAEARPEMAHQIF